MEETDPFAAVLKNESAADESLFTPTRNRFGRNMNLAATRLEMEPTGTSLEDHLRLDTVERSKLEASSDQAQMRDRCKRFTFGMGKERYSARSLLRAGEKRRGFSECSTLHDRPR